MDQQVTGEGLRSDADRIERGGELTCHGLMWRLGNLVPEHGAGASLARHLGHDLCCLPLAQHQLPPGLRKVCRQCPERLREPPARRPAEPPQGAAFLVKDIASAAACRAG